MKIGVIDCELEANKKNKKNPFPNLPLMKITAWHKAQGDSVEFYQPLLGGAYDKVYVSKVFSFTPDYPYPINAKEVVYGGSGFAIRLADGKEVYDKSADAPLPEEIEHIYPDYELYGISDTCYGFLTRGCLRGCSFCHIKNMQGNKARVVASLSEFWKGQKNIVLLDPNISACSEWREVFQALIDSKAWVDFSQGLDIRLMTDEKIQMLMQIKTKSVHFAWDRIEDKDIILPKIEHFKQMTGWDRRRIVVYTIVGDRERKITEGDMFRIMNLRRVGAYPYVMIYDRESLPAHHELKKLQRWVNNRPIWESNETFGQYLKGV